MKVNGVQDFSPGRADGKPAADPTSPNESETMCRADGKPAADPWSPAILNKDNGFGWLARNKLK